MPLNSEYSLNLVIILVKFEKPTSFVAMSQCFICHFDDKYSIKCASKPWKL